MYKIFFAALVIAARISQANPSTQLMSPGDLRMPSAADTNNLAFVSAVKQTIPKLEKDIHNVFDGIIDSDNPNHELESLNRSVKEMLENPDKTMIEMRKPDQIAKLAIHAVFSDEGYDYLDNLLKAVDRDSRDTSDAVKQVADEINHSRFRNLAVKWLKEKQGQLDTIRHVSRMSQSAMASQIQRFRRSSGADELSDLQEQANQLSKTHPPLQRIRRLGCMLRSFLAPNRKDRDPPKKN